MLDAPLLQHPSWHLRRLAVHSVAVQGGVWVCALHKHGAGRCDFGETVDVGYIMAEMIDLLHGWEQHSLYSHGDSRVSAMTE